MFKKIFIELGLTETDATVYEQLVAQRQATPAHIAKISGIPRENVYYILKKLADHGLVMQVPKVRQLTFRITKAHALRSLFDEHEKRLKESKELLEKVVVQIESKLSTDTLRPAVRYYEEISGVKQAFYDFIGEKKEKEMLGIVNYSWPPELDQFFVSERLKAKISLKLLIIPTDRAKKLRATDPKELRETRVMNSNLFPEGTFISVFDEKLLMVHRPPNSEGVGVVIDHKPIAQAYSAMFWMLWGGIDE